ncbi:hypothetical protein Hanom_Chr14g01265161 [Helianthus anomalus]
MNLCMQLELYTINLYSIQAIFITFASFLRGVNCGSSRNARGFPLLHHKYISFNFSFFIYF